MIPNTSPETIHFTIRANRAGNCWYGTATALVGGVVPETFVPKEIGGVRDGEEGMPVHEIAKSVLEYFFRTPSFDARVAVLADLAKFRDAARQIEKILVHKAKTVKGNANALNPEVVFEFSATVVRDIVNALLMDANAKRSLKMALETVAHRVSDKNLR